MDVGQLISSFGGVAWTLVFFVVALSIIVAVHEYGHYIIGRWSGIHAEVFSIGFGPRLLGWTDKHGTHWQVAALPFGGYVKFKGDANAASAPDPAALSGLDAAERRSTMQGAPLWARAATAAAGPVFNFIFSILLFAGLFMAQGQFQDSLKIAKLLDLPANYDIVLEDEIIAIDGKPVGDFQDFDVIARGLAPAPLVDYTVLRDGRDVVVQGPYPYPPIAIAVQPQSAALQAGLAAGDVIAAVDGQPVTAFSELQMAVAQAAGTPLRFTIWRDGATFDAEIAPKRVDVPMAGGGFEARWLIGISGGIFFEPGIERLAPWPALKGAAERTWSIIRSSLSGIWNMITGAISTCNLSGPIVIAETSGQMASMGTISFLSFVAVLSTAVGLMNLFPIPMLDGGHLVFYAYEAVTGRVPSDRALQILMSLGLGLVLTLMVFALSNDLFCP